MSSFVASTKVTKKYECKNLDIEANQETSEDFMKNLRGSDCIKQIIEFLLKNQNEHAMLLERHSSELHEHDERLIELEKLSAEFYDLKVYRKAETDK